MHSAQNFGAHNFLTTTLFESGLGDRPSGPNLGLRSEISYRKGLKFASINKRCQGLAKQKTTFHIFSSTLVPAGHGARGEPFCGAP